MSSRFQPQKTGLDQVKRIVAVSSCKGGVGKSTVAVNLAYALAKQGLRVGLFDADIYGPSLPTMVNTDGQHIDREGDFIKPLHKDGVSLMSFGHIQEHSGPAILRGPIVTQLINQLLSGTLWGELDYLMIDMPPGTGDIQITLSQIIPLTAAIIVTTPQHISFVDVEKGIQMFDSLNVPILSVVENMSTFTCPGCSETHSIFGDGALKRLKHEFGFKHAIQLPIEPRVSAAGDSGTPYVVQHDDHVAEAFLGLAQQVHASIDDIEPQQTLPYIEVDERGIILQESDGDDLLIEPMTLRKACRCAHCEDEFSGERKLKVTEIPDTIRPENVSPVGNYAIGINWSDGHSSLYPYDVLRALGLTLTQK